MAETVGVVGAGALGSLLALKLARAGHAVRVLSRSEERRPNALLREALQGPPGARNLLQHSFLHAEEDS